VSRRGVRTIGDVAQFVTSKNAGPFLLTLDIVFADEATYRTFKSVRPLDRHVIAGLYGIPETDVLKIIEFDPAGYVAHSWSNPDLLDPRLHSCHFDKENNFWVASAPSGVVQKFTHDGSKLLLRIGKNAIYQLAAAPVVVRIARSADRLRRVERELRVTRWLAAVGVPAIRAYEEMISRCWQMITRFVLAQGDRL